jgi:hypothetical protein
LVLAQHVTEDQLDDAWDELTQALDKTSSFYIWSSAERGTWESENPSVVFTFTANTQRK